MRFTERDLFFDANPPILTACAAFGWNSRHRKRSAALSIEEASPATRVATFPDTLLSPATETIGAFERAHGFACRQTTAPVDGAIPSGHEGCTLRDWLIASGAVPAPCNFARST